MIYPFTYIEGQKQTSMCPAGFEPAPPASDRLQTHALDRAATEIGLCFMYIRMNILFTLNKSSGAKKFYFVIIP
jgi:hypothetical protein